MGDSIYLELISQLPNRYACPNLFILITGIPNMRAKKSYFFVQVSDLT